MSEQENLRAVQGLLGAFGRGDLPVMLALISEDVEWVVSGPEDVPYNGERRGHSGVTEFVTQLGTTVEFERFEVQDFVAQGDKVIVLGSERGRVRATGRTFENDWVVAFTLRDGTISRARVYDNTAAVAEAYRG